MPILSAVPWIGQWGSNASVYRADCGPACIAMILEYYGKRGTLTVDQLAHETALSSGASGLMPNQLVVLAQRHGLPMAVHTVTLDAIRYEIDHQRPVCILIAYRFINNRLDIGDNVPGSDGHFLNIVGYDTDHFVANDPDYWIPYESRGHDTFIPITELSKALEAYGNQGIYVEISQMSIAEQITALTAQNQTLLENIEANNAQIDNLAAQITDTPAPVPVPVPATVINSSGANIRQIPSINGKILLLVPANTKLTVLDSGIDANGYRWMEVKAGPVGSVGGYVAKALLSFP